MVKKERSQTQDGGALKAAAALVARTAEPRPPKATTPAAPTNILYYGDNLDVLRRHLKDESVELVYLDPPFNSNANYNVLFAEHGERSAAQIEAFEDTWEWNTEAAAAYEETVEKGGEVAKAMLAFRTLLGTSDMLAYLSMMAPRLVELRRVLKPTGSLYLHCDPTASHYLKLLMDAIFGAQNFRNEIVWHYNTGGKGKNTFLRKHDTILWYSKTAQYIFNREEVAVPRTVGTAHLRHGVTEDGREYYEDFSPRKSGKQYRWYLDEGLTPMDVWTDIPALNPMAKERLGYPTQKPVALLQRILTASSRPGDTVLDPFCGCGTTVDAAQALGRQWIGIDITHLAIGLIKHRLVDRYGPEITKSYRVVGEPTTVEGAAVLAKEDPFQFQAWALGLVGARVAGSDKKGGDKGIDGRLYFHDSVEGPTRQVIFSVKAGHVVPTFIDALWGVMERERAEIGVLLSFNESTAGMRARAADAGFYDSPWGRHPRLQMLTVGELLDGRGIDYPHVAGANVTHRRATRAKPAPGQQTSLFGGKEAPSDEEQGRDGRP
jgi:DNA modification methylase